MQYDALGALTGIFSQIGTGDETVRDRCFQFINNKIMKIGPETITKPLEDFIIAEIKKALAVSTLLEEFSIFKLQ